VCPTQSGLGQIGWIASKTYNSSVTHDTGWLKNK